MGLRPDEFYEMSRADFWLMFDGWNDLKEYEQHIARKQTELIAAAFVGSKGARYVRESWPIGKQKQQSGITDKMREQLAKFKLQEAAKKKANGDKPTDRGKRNTGKRRAK